MTACNIAHTEILIRLAAKALTIPQMAKKMYLIWFKAKKSDQLFSS